MRKAVRYILSSLYILLAIFMTIFLLSKNKYNLAEIGNNTLVIIDQNNELYRSGDLLLIKKQNNTNLSKKDVVFYYNTHSDMKLDIASVVKVEKISSKETTYLLDNDIYISSEYIVGSANNTSVIHFIGFIIKVLASTWGYLLLIVLPLLLLFIYEGYSIFMIARKKNEKTH